MRMSAGYHTQHERAEIKRATRHFHVLPSCACIVSIFDNIDEQEETRQALCEGRNVAGMFTSGVRLLTSTTLKTKAVSAGFPLNYSGPGRSLHFGFPQLVLRRRR